MSSPSRSRTRVVSFLRLFTDIRDGEETSALLMLANVFLVLCAYYFVKPLREGWIAVSDIEGLSKVEVKAYSSFFQALILIPVVSLYGRLSEHWTRSVLITRVTVFFMGNIVIFWALQPGFFLDNLPFMGIVFYLWVGIFGVFIVAQFWAFAADIYSDGVGRRILPLIAIGATAGGAFGASIAGWLVESGIVRTDMLLLVSLVPLGFSIAFTRVVDARETAEARSEAPEDPGPEAAGSADAGEVEGRQGGLSLVLASRFLLAVAIVTLLVNWVNTNGENLLYWVLQDVLADKAHSLGVINPAELLTFTRQETTTFYASFFGMVNWVALILQAFVASRLLRYGGFGALLLLMPVVALVSYSAMAMLGTLMVVKTMKVAENATDYSINNTARNVLWLPVASNVVYKAKPTIDTVGARFGDGLAALTVLVGVNFLALPVAKFYALNIGLVLVWLALSFVVISQHRALSREAETNAPG